MRPWMRLFVASLAAMALCGAGLAAQARAQDAFRASRLLGRGINLGNALEAPQEGAWSITLEPGYFQTIKEAGFDSVRIPIRWSVHADNRPPYRIDPDFFRRVDWAIDEAQSHGLVAVIDMHHYTELVDQPARQLHRLEALWRQIAAHYRDRPESLYFEVLNEPHGRLSDARWDRMVPSLIRAIRATNPRRMLIVGPGYWNNPGHLRNLHLPRKDRRLIVTFHYYSPMPFTHQGADWVRGSEHWRGTTWEGTARQRRRVASDFHAAASWAKAHRRPLFLGEFGAYQEADMASRARWTRAVVQEAEKRGFSWSYWEFASGFGAYDPKAHAWRHPILDALMSAGRLASRQQPPACAVP